MAKNNTKQVKIEDVLELKKVEDNQNKEIENKKEDKANAPLTSVSETKNTDEKPVKAKKETKKEEKEPTQTEEAKEPEEVKNISLANKGKNISSKTAKKSASKNVAQSSENKKERASKKKKDAEPEKKPQRVKRVRTDASTGLTDDQVQERILKGQTNHTPNRNVKTYKRIFFENTVTFFNILCLAVAISLICVGAWSNCLFMAIIIINTAIGIIQEIRAKKTIEKLSLLTAPAVKVVRSGIERTITTDEVVIDDIVVLSNGKQVVADCSIVEGSVEVNESMLTGESLPIKKKVGDTLLAGSFIVSGNCKCRVEKVGANNYIQQLSAKAKQYRRPKSELFNSLKGIIKVIGIIIIPIAILMIINNYSSTNSITKTVTQTAGSIIGMIPSGMFLLCSVTLTVSVIKLSRRQALVQDLYCVEMLARVNVLCLDKTGTITQGSFEVHNHISCGEYSQEDLSKAMKMISSMLDDSGETFAAVKNAFPAEKSERRADVVVPFSSEKKWSGIYVNGYGSLIMGAYEFIFKSGCEEIKEDVKKYSADYRVLVVAYSENEILDSSLPENLKPMGFILIKDKIRNNAEKTLRFFAKQGVDIKVISGDDPLTVSNIAKRVNLKNAGEFIDAKTLDTPEKIKEAANKYTVFGRVTPSQKQELIKAIKEAGRTVAMVGDGVNDVLAMKESDCSVAMAGGSEIARNVSHIVLLNSDFASMPMAVAEGRRAINNIKRSSSLFLVKTIYSFLLSLLFLLISAPYPFIPIQMTLISTVTIGIPSFVLALEPNRERIKGNLFGSIIKTSLPAALSVVFSIILSVSIYSVFKLSYETYSTINVVITGVIGIILIYRISQPLNFLRKSLLWCISLIFILGITKFGLFFELQPLNWFSLLIILPMIVVATAVYDYIYEADI